MSTTNVTVEIDHHLLNTFQLLQSSDETLGELMERAIKLYQQVMFDGDGHPLWRAEPEDDVRRALKILDFVRWVNEVGGTLCFRDPSDHDEREVIVL